MTRRAPALVLTVVAALWLAPSVRAQDSGAADPTNPIAPPMTIGIQLPGEIPGDIAPLSIQVVPSITNKGSQPGELFAPTPCSVHEWKLSDPEGNVVAQNAGAVCTQDVVTQPIGPGETISEPHLIVVQPGLTPGVTYRLDYRYWGRPTAARITPR
jgi:hypothetical protein